MGPWNGLVASLRAESFTFDCGSVVLETWATAGFAAAMTFARGAGAPRPIASVLPPRVRVVEIAVSDDPELPEVEAVAARVGFRRRGRRLRYTRGLDDVAPCDAGWRPLAALDEQERIALVTTVIDSGVLARVAASAGPGWRLDGFAWTPEGRIAGLALPRFPEPSDPELGTFAYLGLVPRVRARGHGARFHLDALGLLRLLGARRYVDATEESHARMQRVFASTGCRRGEALAVLRAP